MSCDACDDVTTTTTTATEDIAAYTPCADEASFKFEKSPNTWKRCRWLVSNQRKKEKRISKYCNEEFVNGDVLENCRQSCNQC